MGWLEKADLKDNTPWWVPGVTLAGAGSGVLVRRCDPFGYESSGAPKHLEGGFYGPEHLGPHMWHCTARADARYRYGCRCGHRGKIAWLCNGHVMMIRQRMSGVCPPCAHPPAEIEIQAQMHEIRTTAHPSMGAAALMGLEGKLWTLQERLNDLVAKGLVHRCAVRLTEVS
jgi:hypothetical protein